MKIKLCFCLMACLFANRGNQLLADEAIWKAGVAKVVVTPETSMWMAGYASRNKPSEGKVHDLYVKALALEDQDGHRLVFVTADLISIPRDLRNWLQDECQKKYSLSPESILLNASHTHCGPELSSTKEQARMWFSNLRSHFLSLTRLSLSLFRLSLSISVWCARAKQKFETGASTDLSKDSR